MATIHYIFYLLVTCLPSNPSNLNLQEKRSRWTPSQKWIPNLRPWTPNKKSKNSSSHCRKSSWSLPWSAFWPLEAINWWTSTKPMKSKARCSKATIKSSNTPIPVKKKVPTPEVPPANPQRPTINPTPPHNPPPRMSSPATANSEEAETEEKTTKMIKKTEIKGKRNSMTRSPWPMTPVLTRTTPNKKKKMTKSSMMFNGSTTNPQSPELPP